MKLSIAYNWPEVPSWKYYISFDVCRTARRNIFLFYRAICSDVGIMGVTLETNLDTFTKDFCWRCVCLGATPCWLV